MQTEITTPGPLLKPDGSLAQKGWARKLLLEYNRKSIKAGSLRIKEWDYYCILNNEFGLAITVADNAYMGFHAVTFFDFINKKEITGFVIEPFTKGRLWMPGSSETGDVILNHKKLQASFRHIGGKRHISFNFRGFNKGQGMYGEIDLLPLNTDSMVIATPFNGNPKAFYYNQKINCLAASGKLNFGGKEFSFEPETSFGVLDWGRGVWTYKNHWYWGSASGLAEGKPFGFNIGYGFGDTTAASENMIFYDGVAHKLDQVVFQINTQNYLEPWRFSSNDGRFEMDFTPVLDRYSNTNLLLLKSKQHQVFGYFTGKVMLDDGKILEIKNLLGFAEDVINRW